MRATGTPLDLGYHCSLGLRFLPRSPGWPPRENEVAPNFFPFSFLRVPGQKTGAGKDEATGYGEIPAKALSPRFGDRGPAGQIPSEAQGPV